jgi:hypothetical protein
VADDDPAVGRDDRTREERWQVSILLQKFLTQAATADPQWVQKAAMAGKAEVSTLPAELQPAVDAMFDRLIAHSDEIVEFGPTIFALILTHLSTGNVSQARLVYLATVASQQERDDALDKATDSAMKDQQDTDAAWAHAKAIAEDILVTGAKVALPILLTALMAAI